MGAVWKYDPEHIMNNKNFREGGVRYLVDLLLTLEKEIRRNPENQTDRRMHAKRATFERMKKTPRDRIRWKGRQNEDKRDANGCG